jgi:CheY-like chemotaxis protein
VSSAQKKPLVMVIEDDASLSALLLRHLESLGVECVHVEDGPAAVALLDQRLPDLVCLDLRLPLMSGYEVGRRLRARPDAQRVGIIVLTGSSGLQEQAFAREVGALTVLTKPFRAVTLRKVVDDFFTQRGKEA